FHCPSSPILLIAPNSSEKVLFMWVHSADLTTSREHPAYSALDSFKMKSWAAFTDLPEPAEPNRTRYRACVLFAALYAELNRTTLYIFHPDGDFPVHFLPVKHSCIFQH